MSIHVESLKNQTIYQNKPNIQHNKKLYSKMVEKTFFIDNEIKISEKLKKTLFGLLHFNYVYDWKTTNITTNIKTKINTPIKTNNTYVVLTYRNKKSNIMDVILNSVNNPVFNGKLFFHVYVLQTYETFLDLLSQEERELFFIDISYDNMHYIEDKYHHIPFFNNFQNCIWIKRENINDSDDEKTDKMAILKSSVEEITYFGNKHIILFILKNTNDSLKHIVQKYVEQLYFLKSFSPNIKEYYKNLCEKYILNNITNKFEEESKHKWYDSSHIQKQEFLWNLLTSKHVLREIELFKLNSFFLNLIFQMIHTFDLSHNIFTELIDYFINALSYPLNTSKYSLYKSSLISYHSHLNFNKSFDNIHQTSMDTLYLDIKEKISIY